MRQLLIPRIIYNACVLISISDKDKKGEKLKHKTGNMNS